MMRMVTLFANKTDLAHGPRYRVCRAGDGYLP